MPSPKSLYREVSDAELKQIDRTKTFQYGGGAEGKYFWDRLLDARWFSQMWNEPHIVRAKYTRAAVRRFSRWASLDGRGVARFAGETHMNQGLLDIRKVS